MKAILCRRSPAGDAMNTLNPNASGAWAWRSHSRTVQLLLGLVAGLLTGVLLEATYGYFFRTRFDLGASIYAGVLSSIWGGIFVFAQPMLEDVGYAFGALLFSIVRRFVNTAVVAPLSSLLLGHESPLLYALKAGRYWIALMIVFPVQLLDAVYTIGWAALIMLLLRYLPYASGRPVGPIVPPSD
jgi:hypothetical protein